MTWPIRNPFHFQRIKQLIFFLSQPSIFSFCLIEHGRAIHVEQNILNFAPHTRLDFEFQEVQSSTNVLQDQEIGNKTPLVKVKTENPHIIFCDGVFFNDVTTVEANLSRILTHFFALFLFRGCFILFSFLLIV